MGRLPSLEKRREEPTEIREHLRTATPSTDAALCGGVGPFLLNGHAGRFPQDPSGKKTNLVSSGVISWGEPTESTSSQAAEDTGHLEAQIRGSRHAWYIRLLSINAQLKLRQFVRA
jgi:hypothetical protein